MSYIPILLDSNLLSIFTEIEEMDLLLALFANHKLHISPTILDELVTAVERGHSHVQTVLNLIGKDTLITVIALSQTESDTVANLPAWMGLGEAECIAICQSQGFAFASFDRRAINYCIREGILYLQLNAIFAALWKTDIVEQSEVRRIVDRLEQDGRHIRDKEEIFQDN